VRIFGIDPGSARTGYGCVQTEGSRHRLVAFGSISAPAGSAFPEKLDAIHRALVALIAEHRPDCIAIEDLFHARNVRSALKLGHARGVALLAAMQAGVPIAEYAPAEIKQAVVGYGRAEKGQIQQMVQLLLGLAEPPQPHDAADALAVAICHSHRVSSPVTRVAAEQRAAASPRAAQPRSWRDFRPRSAAEQGAPPQKR
jgi:crossover junction endodeoxyribonuclease RuvC